MRLLANTANRSAKSGFFIGVTCPGCGGSLELEQDFFVLTCEHCGSALRVKMPDLPPAYLVKSKKNEREIRFGIDRHLKEKNRSLTGADIKFSWYLYPYWKIDGILLKLRNEIVEKPVGDLTDIDTDGFGGYQTGSELSVRQDKMTHIALAPFSNTGPAGIEIVDIPASLGIRTNYLRLVPYSRENIEEGFLCAPVLKLWETVRTSLEKGLDLWDKMNMGDFGKNQTRLFHPRGSIIYFPYCRVQCQISAAHWSFTVDGVTGRIETDREDKEPFDQWQLGHGPLLQFGRLSVDLHRCGTCGADLPGIQSYVYACHNCHDLTFLDESPLIARNLKIVRPTQNYPEDRYFPFWAFKVKIPDMVRLKALFGGIYNSDRIVVPGFRAPNFEALFRLSKRMSSAFAQFRSETIDMTDDHFQPVSVGLDEALTFAEVAINREQTMRKKDISPDLAGFSPESAELFFIPFHQESYFYVDSVLEAVTFEKNMAIA